MSQIGCIKYLSCEPLIADGQQKAFHVDNFLSVAFVLHLLLLSAVRPHGHNMMPEQHRS